MQKRDFIQQAAIEFMPHTAWDTDKSVRYAEKLWHKLSEKGYGGPITRDAGEKAASYYDKLTEKARLQFDLFWRAFALPNGKQRAAMIWGQLGELPDSELQKIIKAASAEAERRRNLPDGMSPCYAEKWLNERRFDDFTPTATEKKQTEVDAKQREIARLTGDLNHAQRMHTDTGDAYWASECNRIRDKIKLLRT